MRKVANIILFIVSLYVIGFFMMPLFIIKANETQIRLLSRGTDDAYNILYGYWIDELDINNPISTLWQTNWRFWCNRIDSCYFADEIKFNLVELKVNIKQGDIYEYNFGKLGDEQGLEIRRQASNFEISELVWPEEGMNPTYRYKPIKGFFGSDSILIYLLEENLENENLKPYVRKRIRIDFNVSK